MIDHESHYELPALPSSLTTEQEGSWFPALPLPELRAAVQRANRDGAEPGSGATRHRVPDRLMAASLIRSRVSSADRELMWKIAVLDDSTPQSQRRRPFCFHGVLSAWITSARRPETGRTPRRPGGSAAWQLTAGGCSLDFLGRFAAHRRHGARCLKGDFHQSASSLNPC
jgi:hypothetical protein